MKPVLVVRHVPHEGLGTISPVLKSAGRRPVYVDAWRNGSLFPSSTEFAALIVMGGPMGVYEKEKHPFLKKVIRVIRRFIEENKPVLGVCLGSQLIAHALGARVYPNGKKEIGWLPLETTAAAERDVLFKRLPRRFTVFHWHGDTFDLPAGAVLLAKSSLCRQAFRFKKNVYGLQFHLEVDAPLIRRWLRAPGARKEADSAGEGRFEKISEDSPRLAPALMKRGEKFFSGFLEFLSDGKSRRPQRRATFRRKLRSPSEARSM